MAELRRVLACLTAVLLAGAAVSTLQERSLDPAAGLDEFVHAERRAQQLPGLAAVVTRSDSTPRVYVSGERRIGKGDLITTADRMHIGSLTKSITATLIGALAEKGLMTLDTTIGQAFPELSPKMQPAYRQVTVRHLLRHSAGIAAYGTNVSLLPMLGLKGTPTEQRRAFLQRVLAEPPRFDPGSRFEYSNAGAAIVGAMAERIAGSPYRELVERLVFAPIGARVAFGNPGLAAEPQPWGHRRIFGAVAEVPPAAPLYTTPLAIEPAGDASPSLSDIARFLQLHLRSLRGQDDGLKARTIQALQGRSPDGSQRGGAVGWNVMPRDGVESHEHFGSSGAYVGYATIQPSRDVAVGVFTNLGGDQQLRDAVARIALRIAARYSANEKVELRTPSATRPYVVVGTNVLTVFTEEQTAGRHRSRARESGNPSTSRHNARSIPYAFGFLSVGWVRGRAERQLNRMATNLADSTLDLGSWPFRSSSHANNQGSGIIFRWPRTAKFLHAAEYTIGDATRPRSAKVGEEYR